MSYDEAGPDTVAFLGRTDDGLPEVVQFEYDSGRTVTAEYRGTHDRGINGDDVVYEVTGHDTPLKMRRAAVDDAYDVAARLGEREGYQEQSSLVDEDTIDPLPTGTGGGMPQSEDSVQALLEDDDLDPL